MKRLRLRQVNMGAIIVMIGILVAITLVLLTEFALDSNLEGVFTVQFYLQRVSLLKVCVLIYLIGTVVIILQGITKMRVKWSKVTGDDWKYNFIFPFEDIERGWV